MPTTTVRSRRWTRRSASSSRRSRRAGATSNALIIVTADHGELLGEHGFVGHMGRMLYEPLLHVPMVVKFPGADRPRGRVDTPGADASTSCRPCSPRPGARCPPASRASRSRHVTQPSLAEEDINPFLVAEYGDDLRPRGARALRRRLEADHDLARRAHAVRPGARPAGDERPRRRGARARRRSSRAGSRP